MRFLVCGIGSIGLRHLKNLLYLGYSDIILFTTGKSCVPEYNKYTKELKKFISIDEALKQKPDICIIANPTSMHVDVALKAAQAGCHLLIEKPLTNKLENLDRLQSFVDKKDLITNIAYQFRFHPHIKALKSVFSTDSGEYGKPLYVSTEWSEYLPDWHPWENYKNGYSARADLGGGVLLTQIHPLNYLEYIFGKIVSVQTKQITTRSLDIAVDDIADFLISFKSGMSGHIHVDYVQKPRVHTMKIVTNRGRFEWDCHKNSLEFLGHKSKRLFPIKAFKRNDMFVEMLDYFIKSVETNTQSGFSIREAIYEIKLLSEELM